MASFETSLHHNTLQWLHEKDDQTDCLHLIPLIMTPQLKWKSNLINTFEYTTCCLEQSKHRYSVIYKSPPPISVNRYRPFNEHHTPIDTISKLLWEKPQWFVFFMNWTLLVTISQNKATSDLCQRSSSFWGTLMYIDLQKSYLHSLGYQDTWLKDYQYLV